MIINKLISFYLILLGGILLGGSPIRDAAEKYIISQFDVDVSIYMHTLKLDTELKVLVQNKVKQRFYRDELYYWNISNNDTTIAYALMDNVLGKSMPITFLVILNNEGNILASEVIKYREAYGSEVGNKNWLVQFTHFSDTTDFKVEKNIDGISGATISVNSLSKGIQKMAVLFPFIKDKLN
jgi:Na+-translocating ferredoxin:NAD+ oxidoreductase RnfG subunit